MKTGMAISDIPEQWLSLSILSKPFLDKES